MITDADQEDPRAYMRVAGRVRQQIIDGSLSSGQPAPSIASLSGRYGLARQTCAKGLRVLEGEGLLRRIPGLGYYVT
jgi:DNA-binding GntR family transcriptional regulator